MTKVIDKDMVKEALRELIREEPATFRNLLKETLIEINNNEEFEQLLKKNFNRFDETFKALA